MPNPTPTIEDNWKKKFDEDFSNNWNYSETWSERDAEMIKDFISSVESSAYTRGQKDILHKMLKGFEKSIINDPMIIKIDSIMEKYKRLCRGK